MSKPKPTASRALVEYLMGELGCRSRHLPGIPGRQWCAGHVEWTDEAPEWTERGCAEAARIADGVMAIVVSELRGMRSSWEIPTSRERLEEDRAEGEQLAAAVQADLRAELDKRDAPRAGQ